MFVDFAGDKLSYIDPETGEIVEAEVFVACLPPAMSMPYAYRRRRCKALILCSQLPVADYYGLFQSELIAEACLDRIVHKSLRFQLAGDSLRKKY